MKCAADIIKDARRGIDQEIPAVCWDRFCEICIKSGEDCRDLVGNVEPNRGIVVLTKGEKS